MRPVDLKKSNETKVTKGMDKVRKSRHNVVKMKSKNIFNIERKEINQIKTKQKEHVLEKRSIYTFRGHP